MTTTGIMPRIADISGGVTDAVTYGRLATLYAAGGQDVPSAERSRRDAVARLLRGAADACGGQAKGDVA
jgi:hypothetical protein